MPDAHAPSAAWLDAIDQAELVRRGEASPAELVDAAIARIEALNPRLNAVIFPLFEKARAAARARDLPDGPFRGVPLLLKDLTAHSAGDPYCGGMRVLKELGWVEREDTFLVRRLRRAGFVITGRTNTPEWGSVPTTEPLAFGPTRNPWSLERSPGGSSGGSAAAVAAGMVAVAHANDGGGSIRIPASACGLVGLKPSRGRVSLGPDSGESWAGLTAELVVSRSVRDTAALLDVLAGPEVGDPYVAPPPARPFASELRARPRGLRVGFRAGAFAGEIPVHPECVRAVEIAARALEEAGHAVEEAHPRALEDKTVIGWISRIITACTARDLDRWSARIGRALGPSDVEPLNWAASEMGRRVTAAQYVEAVEGIHDFSRRVAAWWEPEDAAERFDLLLTPTLAEPPPRLGEFDATTEQPLRGWMRTAPFICFTQPWNVTGQPAISLPLHWSADGLPIGAQLVAGYGREDMLLGVAAQLEAIRPWASRRPPVSA